MKNQYLSCLFLPLLLVTGQMAFAQAPTITALSPARNGRNAPATTNVAITFNSPISSGAPTLGAVRVFSPQRGGLLRNGQGGITSASGNTLTFDPTTNFRPGETILTTVSTQAQNSEGASLARGQVHQFTVGVGGTGRGYFAAPATNPNPAVGDNPISVAVGDVDGDGDLDLLTANASSNTVSVRLNDGSGNFTAPATNPNPAVGSQPYSVALGDVDGDGDGDLLTANSNSNTVSVRLNDGLGNFTAPATNPNPGVGAGPRSVALGDVDGDGDLDLLTANLFGDNVSVRLNDGAGNFTPPATNPNPGVGDGPQSVVLGDVDGDGDLDLLTANNFSNNVSVRLNDGSGNFTAPATNPNPGVGAAPRSVAVGDVDGDGDLDLLTANSTSDNVSVRLNNGSGNFTPPATNPNPGVGDGPQSVALGDVDGDGDGDLLTANNASDNVSVRLNDGSGNFTAPATNPNPGVSVGPFSVAVGDVDGDGDLDLLTANLTSNTVSVRLNQPQLAITTLSPARNGRNAPATTNVAITFDQPMSSGSATLGAVRVFSAQRGGLLRNRQGGITSASGNTLTFDPTTTFRPGETILTTVTSQVQSSAGVSLARGQVHQFTVGVGATGVGRFTPPATNADPAVGNRPNSVAVGDVDGDGDLDFVAANSSSNTVSVRLNNGSGGFTAPATNPNPAVGSQPYSVALGDVDGDGDLDFVAANQLSNTVSILLNNGSGNFTPPATNPNPGVGNGPFSVALGDVDGDGDLDLLTTYNVRNSNGNVSVLLNDGSGNFTPHPTSPNPAVGINPTSVVLGDVDGDGDLDLLTANAYTNTVSVRLNDGSGGFTAPAANPDPGVGDGPNSVALGDVDGDGDLDFIAANAANNTVSVLLNNGSGNFTPRPTNPNPGVGDIPAAVALGDVDGDGDLDLLTANSGSNTVSILLNDGSGNFTPPATNPNPAVSGAPVSVVLGDVDGDGDLDLLTANSLSANVSVRLNQPLVPTLAGFAVTPNPVCVGSPLTFAATVGNLSPPYAFTLSNGISTALGSAASTAFSQVLTASGSGVQTFTLTISSQGQVVTATTPVIVNALPVAGLVANGPLSCSQPSVMLSASGGGTYRFSSGASQVNGGNTATVTQAGLYSVTVTSANGCTAVASTTVAGDQSVPMAGLTDNGPISRSTPSVTLTASGGSTYRFSTGATQIGNGPTATVSTAGIYSVTVVSSNGCSAVASTTVTSDEPVITALSPARNGRNAPATTNVAITFDRPISSGTPTLGAVRVFSAQRGGLLRNGQGGSTSASGNTLTFDPTTNFRPGETILTTVTAQAQSSAGANLARGQVHQFTVGVGGTGRGNFAPPATNPAPAVGDGPISVAVGDVDGDGDGDLLTANSSSNTVSVLLNDGSGNFTPHPTNPNPVVGNNPTSVVLGDVDGDGDLDLLTANFFSDNVSVRLNDGAGNFTPPTTNPDPPVGSFPVSVVLGDVDGDGDLDLLTANYASDNVSVRLNNGSGSFTAPATNPNPAVGAGPRSVAVGDVDGDGDLDLLTANERSNRVSVRLNDGSGNFTAPATNPNPFVSEGPWSIALGDVDGDGDLDFITANSTSDDVGVRLNDGSGNFTPHPTNPRPGVGDRPFSVALGDVDGDGDLDLLTANSGSNTVSVLLNNGSGNFTAPAANPNPGVGSFPESVALGDVDGDGDLDLLTANFSDNRVSVRLNGPLPTPDLTLLLFAQPTLVYGTTSINVVVNVYELNGVVTSGPVSVKLSEDALLKLGFDPTATSVGGKPVQNPSWQFSGPVDGIYTLTSTQPLPAGGRLSVGLSGPLTPGATKGKLSVSATVVDPSGTEARLNNNQDAETIEYFKK